MAPIVNIALEPMVEDFFCNPLKRPSFPHIDIFIYKPATIISTFATLYILLRVVSSKRLCTILTVIYILTNANLMNFIFRDDVSAVERIAHELCEDQASSGVLYFEVRYCPHLLCSTGNDMMNGKPVEPIKEPNMTVKETTSPRAVVQAVSRGLKRGERDFGLKARSILCCIRPRPGSELHT